MLDDLYLRAGDFFAGLPQVAVVLLLILIVVITLSWIFLPFAIFGTKSLMKQQKQQLERQEDLLEKIEMKLNSEKSAGLRVVTNNKRPKREEDEDENEGFLNPFA